jgi:hypothetical protein
LVLLCTAQNQRPYEAFAVGDGGTRTILEEPVIYIAESDVVLPHPNAFVSHENQATSTQTKVGTSQAHENDRPDVRGTHRD